jgi:hypothetical protein
MLIGRAALHLIAPGVSGDRDDLEAKEMLYVAFQRRRGQGFLKSPIDLPRVSHHRATHDGRGRRAGDRAPFRNRGHRRQAHTEGNVAGLAGRAGLTVRCGRVGETGQ